MQYKDNVYRNGNIIEVWQGERTEFQAFKKINGSYQSTYSGWRGEYLTGNGAYAWYEPTEPGQLPIMVTHETDTLRLQVLAKSGTGVPNLKDVLKMLVMEVLREKNDSVTKELVQLRQDSASVSNKLNQNIAAINTVNTEYFVGSGTGLHSMTASNDVSPEIHILLAQELQELKQNAKYNNYMISVKAAVKNRISIWKRIETERFLLGIIDDPTSFNRFLDDMLLNSGQLLARLLVNNFSDQQRTQAKEIVISYINEQIRSSIK